MKKKKEKEIKMDSFEVMITRTVEQMENMMRGKSPEFYNNVGMALGGLIIWNFSLILGLFINYNNMHWMVYLMTNICMICLSHHLGVEIGVYFGRLNGWWLDMEGAKKVYALQWENLKKVIEVVKEDIKENNVDLSEEEDDENSKKKD